MTTYEVKAFGTLQGFDTTDLDAPGRVSEAMWELRVHVEADSESDAFETVRVLLMEYDLASGEDGMDILSPRSTG